MHTDIFRGEVLQYLGIVLKYYRNLANVKSYYIQMIGIVKFVFSTFMYACKFFIIKK